MASEERVEAAQDLAQRALQVQARLRRQNVPFGVLIQPDEEGNPQTATIQTGYMVVALAEMLATALERGEIRVYHGDPGRIVMGPPPGITAAPGVVPGYRPDRPPQITMDPVDPEEKP